MSLAKAAYAGARAAWPAPTLVAARHEPDVLRALLGAFRIGSRAVDAHRLDAAARAGDAAGLLRALHTPATLAAVKQALKPRLAAAYVSGAALAAKGLAHLGIPTKAVAKREALGVDLSAVNPKAVAWAEAHAAALVVADAAIRAQINALVVASQADRIPVADLARQVRALIGLDARRMAAIASYEARLAAENVPKATLLAKVARRSEALLRDRALTIARTETIGALAAGQQALWDQAVGQGLLDRTAVGKVWIITPDDLLCDECDALDGEVVGLDEEFEDGVDGPPLHPNCRCATGIAPLM